MKPNASLEEIAAALRSAGSCLVLSHVRPDGDALGCQIAMALCLQQLGKTVEVWNEDGMLDKYRFLPRSELVTRPPGTPRAFDVAIALDTAAHDRLGNTLQSIGETRLWLNIDHHVSNDRFGDLVHIDPTAPATGQILYELFRSQNLPFTYEMADNLFVAISTDTGSFQYPNTTARSFEIGADLVRAGANVGQLSQRMYESYPRRRIDLLRELLNVLRIECEGRVASFSLDAKTASRIGVLPEDNEGLIDHIRAIHGVLVAIFFEELPDGKVRVSMRSKTQAVDVCAICRHFGGGGHTLAAGARIRGTLADVERRVLEETCNRVREAADGRP